MHRKGLYKIAIEWPWNTPSKPKVTPPEPAKFMYKLPPKLPKAPPPGIAPANGALLETKTTTESPSWDNQYMDPTKFLLHNRHGSAIPVNTMTDTPYFFNTVGWQPPTDRPFNYSELYNAQVDDTQGWHKYQEYRRNLPLEDINKVTKVPSYDANIRGTDQYSSADDFVNTVGQGPLFRWYDVPSYPADVLGSTPGPQFDHTPIYALSLVSFPEMGRYHPAGRKTPYKHILLSKDPTKGKLDKPYLTSTKNVLSGDNNGLVDASRPYLPLPQMMLAGHEMAHVLTDASRAPGTEFRWPGGFFARLGGGDGSYSYIPAEQVQAVHTLNKSYQALLNSLAKGNHEDMPSAFRKLVSSYPAYGSKEQFMARNDALLAHPELAAKYLGVEPSRALAQLKQLKHNAGLQRQGLHLTDPRVIDAQKHLDFFNDNYFADASFNGNAAQRTV